MENTNAVSIPLVDVLSKMLSKRVVMSGDKYVEFDGIKEIPQEIVDEAILKQKKEIEEQLNSEQVQEAKQYLQATGWIWEKYNRNVLVLKDTTSEEFEEKYADIIAKQEECRLLINELES